jgi:hypothetical protein
VSDERAEPVRSHQPFDRLTYLSAEMTGPLERPENEDVKAIVFLQDGQRGGIQIHGYDDDIQAMADLFAHLKAVFASIGKDLQLIAIPDSPQGLEDLPG